MSEGLMVLTSENVWSCQLKSYKTRSHVHWCLQMLGAALSIAGTFVLYVTKKRHFRSIHGILGMASVGIMIFLSFSGATVFYAYQMRRFIKPVAIKGLHNFLGIACFVIGIVSQCYGYKKRWMTKKAGEDIATLCLALTAISTLICLYRPILSFYRQTTTLFSRG
uniref:ascorbate ferrireductase (transmembrane) n=1 Tax=Bracon brevicornis TaxID=1563983 RepID=A0A6V7M6Y7_9HYME